MEADNDIKYETREMTPCLSDFIRIFWHLENYSSQAKTVSILPDGYFDILFTSVNQKPFKAMLAGLSTQPILYQLPARTEVFAISFKLPAADYILKIPIAALNNQSKKLPVDFWGIDTRTLTSFDGFITLIEAKMMARLGPAKMDDREKNLFDMLYKSNGLATVEEISAGIFWTSRQIHRYFKHRFGIPLKTYCNILRFRESFSQLKKGQLFPKQGYFDQPHFIRQVKKYAATSPKYLAENQNDRFIQLTTLVD